MGFGIANNSLMGGDLLLATDFVYKFRDDAGDQQDIYGDQAIPSVAAQRSRGSWP
ncbi:MAG: hypothetical protein K9M02_16600 [Thiohalocapsa sp.]|nr:hypothetical protein [Thiohalocapsa sp.]